ncbi:acetyl-CoA acetyltransferase [Advenella kashmirensis W13003]|uniref:Acetyl-CoA acetyltransferase n=1 Tax=Advenella kashmirensis W13003 TaxID=1424334 RepID=V8QPI7_9BURK|nr:CoA transferase [Advenella kashmirensis]ETF01253.1 acetyl-CoA acetyltransferase [Advenella kashmirensis W13003]
MAGALDGIRVIDLTSVGMGPMATQMLGDMGADVIKVESHEGDVFRHVTPQRHRGMSHAYLNFNRNKRSVVLDIKTATGKDQLHKLLLTADVLVSNMRASAMRRLGLDYASLRERLPTLIYCSCYGYSEKGSYAGRPAIDDTIQAASGLAWIQGAAGQGEPNYMNSVIADKVVALYVSNAIVSALFAREKNGLGQAVEVPMFECMTAFLAPEHLAGMTFVPPEGPAGYARLLNEYRRPFRCSDGYISVVPYTDGQWQRFFELTRRPDLADDMRFRTATERSKHFPELYRYVEQVLVERTTEEWTQLLTHADIPFSKVNSIADLIADPHLASCGFWQETDHPSEGRIIQAGIPVRFSGTPGEIRRHAPMLGEHTKEVLQEIVDQAQPTAVNNNGDRYEKDI